MSNFADRPIGTSRGSRARWVTLMIVASLCVPVTVFSGVNAWEARKGNPDARQPGAIKAASVERQRIRCWQDGRLIFEEQPVITAAESLPYQIKWQGAGGSHAYLLDLRNATCLVASAPETAAPNR